MEKCPRCGKEVSKPSKEWNYAAFHVKLFNCEKCDKTFKAYYRQGKLSHTIPKGRKKRTTEIDSDRKKRGFQL